MATPFMQPLGQTFLAMVQSKTGVYFQETDELTLGKHQDDSVAFELLAQNEDIIALYRIEEGGHCHNVSHEYAEAWLNKLADSFNPATDTWPAFIQRHISPLSLEEIEDEIRNEINWDREHRAAYSTPV